MSLKDAELDAHKIYEGDGSKFLDLTVFNEVMCKNPKWMLNIDRDNTRSHRIDEEPNEESGGSTKRSRTSEEGEYVVHSNQETPNSSGSTIQRPIGRDAAKKKGKGKASQSFSFPNNEFVEELYAIRITRESEIEVMNKRLEVDKKREEREIKREEMELKREEREIKKEERNTKKMYLSHLNALLAKDHVSPEEEDMKYQPSRARRVYCDREHEQREARLMADYFMDNPTFDEVIFRRRFRKRKHLFLRIVDAVTATDRYFHQRPDATGRQSLSSLQKCTGAMRVLAYGMSFDVVDEYLRISGVVTRKSLISFVQGSCNDINVLHRSPVFSDVLEVRAPKVSCVMNGNRKNMAYYLTDGIYPSWAAFVKSITSPQIRKHRLFAEHQEAVRKDVEQTFGVLQARFAFL
ncbi:glutathione S-transferase T3-like protein [Tanacetum coccineum]